MGFAFRRLFLVAMMLIAVTSVRAEDSHADAAKAPAWFSKLDQDGNGSLDREESGRFFEPLNADSDDKVTVAEAVAYMKTRAVERVRAGGRGSGPIVTSTALASRKKTGNGLWIVSLGHSCVAPAMRPLSRIAPVAGFENHTQVIQIHGGGGGAAKAQWERGKTEDAKPALASGKIDVLTFGHLVAFNGQTIGCDVEDYERWVELGLKHNPRMKFYIQDLWPWLTDLMPEVSHETKVEDFTLEKYEAALGNVSKSVADTVDELNRKFPGRVSVIPVAPAMVGLVRRVIRNELPGVDAVLVPPGEQGGGAIGLYRDKIHPTDVIAKLEGYIYFACLYGKNPMELESGIYRDEKLDKILREVAWETVTEHPLSGVSGQTKDE